jgi:hypothetical protein
MLSAILSVIYNLLLFSVIGTVIGISITFLLLRGTSIYHFMKGDHLLKKGEYWDALNEFHKAELYHLWFLKEDRNIKFKIDATKRCIKDYRQQQYENSKYK